jgi:cobalt-zinc-cadmium efflux system membrane fusion protein
MKIKHPDIVRIQEEYAKLMTEMTFIKKELLRQQQLASNEAASSKRVDEVMRDLSLLEASQKALESRLGMISINPEDVIQGIITDEVAILSPSDGSITRIDYNAGRLVPEDAFLLEIVDKKHLHLAMDIFEDQSEALQKGQRIEFFLPGSDRAHMADLMLIGQWVDPIKRTILVHAHPKEDLEVFVPGMQVQGNVLLEEHESLSIPASAIFSTEDGKKLVFLPDGQGRFTWKELKAVKMLDDYAMIDEQELNAAVVTDGAWYLFGLWNQ